MKTENKSCFLLILLNYERLVIVGPVLQVFKVSLGDVLERGEQVLFICPPKPINLFLTKRVHSNYVFKKDIKSYARSIR